MSYTSGLSPNKYARSAAERREDKEKLKRTLSEERVAEMRKVSSTANSCTRDLVSPTPDLTRVAAVRPR